MTKFEQLIGECLENPREGWEVCTEYPSACSECCSMVMARGRIIGQLELQKGNSIELA